MGFESFPKKEIPSTNTAEEIVVEKSTEQGELSPEEIKNAKGEISESVRLLPMMQGGESMTRTVMEKFSGKVSKDVIDGGIADGLEGMTSYENKTVEQLTADVKETQAALGLSSEDTARLLNQGLESVVSRIKELQDKRNLEMADEKTEDWKKESLQNDTDSANAFVAQQKYRALEISAALNERELSPEEKKASDEIGESVRMIPMMSGGESQHHALMEKFTGKVPQDVIDSGFAQGLEEMTTYENKSAEQFANDIRETQTALGLSREDTVKLLNQGLQQLDRRIQKLQNDRGAELMDEKTPASKKESLREDMKSAEAFIEQQKKRAFDIISILNK